MKKTCKLVFSLFQEKVMKVSERSPHGRDVRHVHILLEGTGKTRSSKTNSGTNLVRQDCSEKCSVCFRLWLVV